MHITSLCAPLRQQIATTLGPGVHMYIFKLKPLCLEVLHSTPMFWVHLLGEQLTLFNTLMPRTPFQVTDCLLPCYTDMDCRTVGWSDLPKTVGEAGVELGTAHPQGCFWLLDDLCSPSTANNNQTPGWVGTKAAQTQKKLLHTLTVHYANSYLRQAPSLPQTLKWDQNMNILRHQEAIRSIWDQSKINHDPDSLFHL